MPVTPYGDDWVPRVAERLMQKCAEVLFIKGVLSKEEHYALRWSDAFDFPGSGLYGFENNNWDLLVHPKEDRIVSYRRLMRRMDHKQLMFSWSVLPSARRRPQRSELLSQCSELPFRR